jgi:hypothetical protein
MKFRSHLPWQNWKRSVPADQVKAGRALQHDNKLPLMREILIFQEILIF